MKKVPFLIAVIIMLISPVFALEVTIVSLAGKVQIQPMGGPWQTPEIGQEILLNTKISTGFNSRAVLRVGDSDLFLQPLTRLTVEELKERSGNVTSSISMKAGRLRARVKTSSKTIDFSVRTPIATAAVRGTDFILSPDRLRVTDGLVEFLVGDTFVLVPAGSYTRVSNNRPLSPIDERATSWAVSPYAGPTYEDSGDHSNNRRNQLGTSIIKIN